MNDAIFRGDFEALATPQAGKALTLFFEEGSKEILDFMSDLWNVETTDDPFKQSLTMSGVGLMRQMPEGNRIRKDKMRQGRAKVYFGDVYNLAIGYSRQTKRADKSGAILRAITSELTKAYVQTRNIIGALRYANAFVAQGDEPDGVSWCATNHPLLRRVDSNTVWSNRSATDAALSYTSLSQAYVDGQLTLSDSGRRDPIIFTELLVGPALVKQAWELTNSDKSPDPTRTSAATGAGNTTHTSSTTQSFVKGKMGITTPVINPYWFGSPTQWFVRRPLSQIHIHWYDFMEKVFDTYMDFNTKFFWQDVSAEWGFGAEDMRGLYGSSGVG